MLKNHLPSEWTVDEVPEQNDYGVDAEVGIFLLMRDGHSSATGLTFKAQSRATTGKSLTVYLTQRQYNYMQSLDVPVLIAQAHISSSDLYAGWLHSRPTERTGSGDRLRFELSDEDRWTPATPNDIVNSVKAYRLIHKGVAFPPLNIRVTSRAAMASFDIAELVRALSVATQELSHLVSVSEGDPAPNVAAISLASDGPRVGLGEVASIRLPPFEIHSPSRYRYLAADLLFCLAELLAMVGYGALSLRLAAAILADTLHSRSLRLGGLVAATADPLLLQYSVRLCKVAVEVGHPLEPALLSQVVLHGPTLPEGELPLITDLLRARASASGLAGVEQLIGAVSHRLVKDGQADGAAAVWQTAEHILPQLADRYYVLRAKAGAEFLARQYADSARDYEKALSRAPSDEALKIRALLADAYLKTGRLIEAREHFSSSEQEPEWRLKLLVLAYLIDRLGIRELAAVPDMAWAGSVDFTRAAHAEEVVRLTIDAARRSGGDSLLWFNAASRLTELRGWRLTAELSLVASVLGDPYDPESMALAIVRWLSLATAPAPGADGDALVLQLLLQVAADKYGSSILEYYGKYDIPAAVLSFISDTISSFLDEAGVSWD